MSALHRSVVASADSHIPATFRNSAQIHTHHRFSLGALRAEYRTVCADLIAVAFPGPSPNAQANAATKATGIPHDTFYRILRQETQVPDITAVLAALHCSRIGADTGSRAYALLMQIMGAQ